MILNRIKSVCLEPSILRASKLPDSFFRTFRALCKAQNRLRRYRSDRSETRKESTVDERVSLVSSASTNLFSTYGCHRRIDPKSTSSELLIEVFRVTKGMPQLIAIARPDIRCCLHVRDLSRHIYLLLIVLFHSVDKECPLVSPSNPNIMNLFRFIHMQSLLGMF